MSQFTFSPSYYCNITGEVMGDPVTDREGNTYERTAITQWLSKSQTSPITRNRLVLSDLVPNRAIQHAIQEAIRNQEGQATSAINGVTNPQLEIPVDMEYKQINTKSPFDGQKYNITFSNTSQGVFEYATNYVFAIDTSCSMTSNCPIADGEGPGLTRLQIVVHSLKTIVTMTNPGDTVTIIIFNDSAQNLFEKRIDNTTRAEAIRILDSLEPNGGTNLLSGLYYGLEAAKRVRTINKNTQLIFLSDGQDSNAGEIPHRIKMFLKRPENSTILNDVSLTTIGISYDVDSKPLFDIAELFNGNFFFIPDGSMVGTIFCNIIVNASSPHLTAPKVKLINQVTEVPEGSEFKEWVGLCPEEQFEIVRIHCANLLKVICAEGSRNNRHLTTNMREIYNRFKSWITSPDSIFKSEQLENIIKDFVSDESNHEQITKALSRDDWYNKWGHHYLLSLSCALSNRICHNFKDQGVKGFGCSDFDLLVDKAEEIFSKITPPKPIPVPDFSNYSSSSSSSYASAPAPAPTTVNMSSYIGRGGGGGGCFAGHCKVKLGDGTLKRLDELDGTELVYQGVNLSPCSIKYVVKISINGPNQLCRLGDLVITPWHPIFDSRSGICKWVFPNQLASTYTESIDYVFNLVLESGHYAEIEGFNCVTLGHGLTDFTESNEILKHQFYGTNQVIQALEQFHTDESQIINLSNYTIDRSPETNLVIGINKMTDCIICMESFSQEHIITSTCSHGPYCHTCYNNITSPPNPTCAICRGPLTRSNNPNPLYANNNNNLHNDLNLHRFIIERVINQGTYINQINQGTYINQFNQFNQFNQVNQVNQFNQVNQPNNHVGNGYTTPPRTRPSAIPPLTQERIYADNRRTAREIGHGIQFNEMMIGNQ